MSLPKNYLDVHYEAEGRYRVWVFRNNQPRTQCYREHLFTVVLLAKRLNCAIRADNKLKAPLKAHGATVL